MTTLTILNDLTAVLVPLGVLGAAIAVAGALLAGIAFALGAAELGGGAAAFWIGGAILSITAGFAGQWAPTVFALAALLLVGGGAAVRTLRGVFPSRRPATSAVN